MTTSPASAYIAEPPYRVDDPRPLDEVGTPGTSRHARRRRKRAALRAARETAAGALGRLLAGKVGRSAEERLDAGEWVNAIDLAQIAKPAVQVAVGRADRRRHQGPMGRTLPRPTVVVQADTPGERRVPLRGGRRAALAMRDLARAGYPELTIARRR